MKHLNNYITEYIIKKKLDKPIYSGTPILYTPKNNGELVDLIIKLLNDDETNLNCIDVSNVKVMQNLFDYVNDNVIVKLKDISHLQMSKTPTSINHDNQTRYISVTANVDSNHNIGFVSKKVQSKLNNYKTN